jgi:hypothetical protein
MFNNVFEDRNEYTSAVYWFIMEMHDNRYSIQNNHVIFDEWENVPVYDLDKDDEIILVDQWRNYDFYFQPNGVNNYDY